MVPNTLYIFPLPLKQGSSKVHKADEVKGQGIHT